MAVEDEEASLKAFEKWREEQYRRVVRGEIEWMECRDAIDRELWRIAKKVRKERRKELCEEVDVMLQNLVKVYERMENICEEINKDNLLSLGGRAAKCVDARENLNEAITTIILWLATLAVGIPEWERKALEWEERWGRRKNGSIQGVSIPNIS